MGLVATFAASFVLWVVLWAVGVKAFDGIWIVIGILIVAVVTKLLVKYIPGRETGKRAHMARVGILTGGGDCPGLNAVIRGVVRRGLMQAGDSVVGFRYGWAGAMGGEAVELTLENTKGILPRGGTILGTSRTNPYNEEGGPQKV